DGAAAAGALDEASSGWSRKSEGALGSKCPHLSTGPDQARPQDGAGRPSAGPQTSLPPGTPRTTSSTGHAVCRPRAQSHPQEPDSPGSWPAALPGHRAWRPLSRGNRGTVLEDAMGSPGTELQGPRDPACVKGTPVSRGSVTAPARVVKTLDSADCIQPGDILVTNATDIGWSPYFPLLSGLVTELGGLLSHGKRTQLLSNLSFDWYGGTCESRCLESGVFTDPEPRRGRLHLRCQVLGAVIAREYGLPCVVGVENATDIFASGDIILLDATRGMVTTIKTAAAQEDS
ncbi:hypothetical protein HPB47_003008, partial [Ixodes persulcatus]